MVLSKDFRLVFAAAALIAFGSSAGFGQSTDQNFPTPVTTNEINGQIRARDIGDSRLTRYFYAFDGGQGDIFINVVTKNLAGDIDVFSADTLRPLAKMVIYPDAAASETGRLVYLRKNERLILRIEGRSPNDDPATFRIKFGGSFIALAGEKGSDAPSVKKSDESKESGVRVNSVGTIVEVIPKPSPPKVIAESKPAASEPVAGPIPDKSKPGTPVEKRSDTGKPKVVVTEAPEVATIFGGKKTAEKKVESKSDVAAKPKSTATRSTKTNPPAKPSASASKASKPVEAPVEKKPDPLASIRLVVQLKSGETIERPMSEVLRFSVDKGVLTVIGSDGKVSRYSILDVAKVTIE